MRNFGLKPGARIVPVVHLHWLYDKGPSKLKETAEGRAYSMCGRTELRRDELTAYLDDTNCPRCVELATLEERDAP